MIWRLLDRALAFESFSTFLEWAASARSNSRHITHYLDDFLFVGPARSPACAECLRSFQALAEELGVPLAAEKTVGPEPRIIYLGILLDSALGLSRLPEDKLATLRELLSAMRGRAKCTLRDMPVLMGHLNFACKVVRPGRAFCTHLAKATVAATAPQHHIRVTRAIKADLEVWSDFLEHYNYYREFPAGAVRCRWQRGIRGLL